MVTSTPVTPGQRYTRRNPCPICGGGRDDPRGRGIRCWGHAGDDGRAHCTRDDYAGDLPPRRGGDGRNSYAHRLDGLCGCGETHGGVSANQKHGPTRADSGRIYASHEALPDVWMGKRLAGLWSYHDADGALLFEVRRYNGTGGAKDYVPFTSRADGRWVAKLEAARVFYRLPELLATPSDAPVVVVEGEKCADAARTALRAAGKAWPVTTTQGGAKNGHLTSLDALKGRQVVILPDNDADGETYQKTIAKGARGAGATQVATLRLEGLTMKGDVADWLAAGHDGAELAQLITDTLSQQEQTTAAHDESEQWAPLVQTARDLMRKELPPVRWAVKDAIPEGLNLLAGKPKKGKSTFMLQTAASTAQGANALGYFETARCDVLYLALEDNERRMQKRLRQMLQGEDAPAGLCIAYSWPPLDRGGLEALEKYLDANPAIGMVVVDTLEHIRPARRSNGGYGDDYASVRGLQQLAGQRQLAIVAITHLRKAAAEDPFDEINATMGLLASIDNALVMRSANGLVELHRRGRDFEDDSTLALKGDRDTLLWRVEGQAHDVMRSAERKAIIEVLPDETMKPGMKPMEIAEALGKPVGTIRKLLWSMMREEPCPITKDDHGSYHTLGNAGNAGNGDAFLAHEPARILDLWAKTGVTDGVTALPMGTVTGNATSPPPSSAPDAHRGPQNPIGDHQNSKSPMGKEVPYGANERCPVTGGTHETANLRTADGWLKCIHCDAVTSQRAPSHAREGATTYAHH